jgi:hypothetical protein
MTDSRIVVCLEKFARGNLSRSSLEDCLKDKARLHFWDTNQRKTELSKPLPRTQFSRADIDAQLGRFLTGQLDARELSDWAGAMRLLGCFVLNEDDPGSSEVWDLMDELMSPDVWGEPTVEGVLDLRRRLASVS